MGYDDAKMVCERLRGQTTIYKALHIVKMRPQICPNSVSHKSRAHAFVSWWLRSWCYAHALSSSLNSTHWNKTYKNTQTDGPRTTTIKFNITLRDAPHSWSSGLQSWWTLPIRPTPQPIVSRAHRGSFLFFWVSIRLGCGGSSRGSRNHTI